jgi:hypothetical protein
MSTKQQPGNYDCYAKLADDEPYFVLRAKDLTAPAAVEEWIARRLFEWFLWKGHAPMTPEYRAKLDEARACAVAMREWKDQHPTREGFRQIFDGR